MLSLQTLLPGMSINLFYISQRNRQKIGGKMKLTKEEKDLIEENRRKEQDKKEEAEYWENYDACYCYDEYGNWKYK